MRGIALISLAAALAACGGSASESAALQQSRESVCARICSNPPAAAALVSVAADGSATCHCQCPSINFAEFAFELQSDDEAFVAVASSAWASLYPRLCR